jgi:Flp pilus assembly pilin Flp
MRWNVKQIVRRFLRGNRGQMVAEYSVLLGLFTVGGVAVLVTFFFAFEEGVIGYYEDIVNVICLPIP